MEQVHELSGMESVANIDCISGVDWVNVVFDLTTEVQVIQPTLTVSPNDVTPSTMFPSSLLPLTSTSSQISIIASDIGIQISTSVIMSSPISSPSKSHIVGNIHMTMFSRVS